MESCDAVDVFGESEGEAAGEARFLVAYAMFFILYFMLTFYGQQILRSVLEEKSSRIVEVVLSSLRPSELMMGNNTRMRSPFSILLISSTVAGNEH